MAEDVDCAFVAAVVEHQVGLGTVVAISDAMILRNGAFVLPENRAFLVHALGGPVRSAPWGGRPRVVLATQTAANQPATPFQSVANARLLPFLLQLLLLWLALGWWKGATLLPACPRPPSIGTTSSSTPRPSDATGSGWARSSTRRVPWRVARWLSGAGAA